MEAFQRQGIATALIHALQSQAAADGRDVIFVATERSNTAAMGLYAATGAAAEPDSILFTYAVANEAE
jgi:ribosomal protein S18 acetylase RimI-like enzyme